MLSFKYTAKYFENQNNIAVLNVMKKLIKTKKTNVTSSMTKNIRRLLLKLKKH